MKVSTEDQGVTHLSQLDENGYYTYAQYLTWTFNERVELIKGKLFKILPAPDLNHQMVSSNLIPMLNTYFSEKKGHWFHAPFDVRFPSNDGKATDTVVQPDLCVVCDLKKLDKQGCNGAPDLVIEILSPGNTQKEMNDKFMLYENSGVREYWLAHPKDQWLVIYHLSDEGKYIGTKHFMPADGIAQSFLFKDLVIDLNKVFDLLELDKE